MTIERIKSWTPVIISITAVVVSFITLYLSSLRPAILELIAGETMQVYHQSDGELRIDIPVVFSNKGTRSGVIMSVGLILRNPETQEAILLKWDGHKVFEKGIWVFRAFDSPIAISGDSQIVQMVNFKGGAASKGWVPMPVKYDLFLIGWTKADQNPDIRYGFQFTLHQKNTEIIKQNYIERNRNGEWITGTRFGSAARPLSLSEFHQMTK